jgi:hypothetical protein
VHNPVASPPPRQYIPDQEDLCCSVMHAREFIRMLHSSLTHVSKGEEQETRMQEAALGTAGVERMCTEHAERPTRQISALKPWTRDTVATAAPIAPGRSTPILCEVIAGLLAAHGSW